MARMRFGVHRALEREADRLIRESLKDVRRPSEIDVMTPWKSADRKRREIMVSSGTPDASIRSGMFHRSANRGRPDLNARDGIARSSGPTRGFSDSTGSSPYGSSFGSMSPDGMGLSLGEILGQDDGE